MRWLARGSGKTAGRGGCDLSTFGGKMAADLLGDLKQELLFMIQFAHL